MRKRREEDKLFLRVGELVPWWCRGRTIRRGREEERRRDEGVVGVGVGVRGKWREGRALVDGWNGRDGWGIFVDGMGDAAGARRCAARADNGGEAEPFNWVASRLRRVGRATTVVDG